MPRFKMAVKNHERVYANVRVTNYEQGCREKSKFFIFSKSRESQGISFLVRKFYDIAIKKSGKGQNSAHSIVVR